MKSQKTLILLMLVVLPVLVGCFGQRANPVATDASLSPAAPTPAAAVNGTSALSSVTPSRRFSYAEPPHAVSYKPLDRCGNGQGGLRIGIVSAASAEHIYLTINEVSVKPAAGKGWTVIRTPAREVDLKSGAEVSEVLADQNLPVGVYNQMRFRIVSARVVLDGRSYNLVIPSDRIRFVGKFEIKTGFRTELTIRLFNKIVKTTGHGALSGLTQAWMFCPVVKITSSLTPVAPPSDPAVTTGVVHATIANYVSKVPLAGVQVALSGTSFSGVTDAEGLVRLEDVTAGDYVLTLTHPDYLNKSFPVQVVAGQEAVVTAELNPAIIESGVGNTGWFSLYYPADANGTFIETKVETPLVVDFVSLAFTRVVVSMDCEYSRAQPEAASLMTFLSANQQVFKSQDLGSWWAGWDGNMGENIGFFNAYQPANHVVVDVTDYVRNNPSNTYFMAFYNQQTYNARVQNMKMTIYYR